MQIIMYTDGSSRGNPGPGGYGVVMLAIENGQLLKRLELSEGFINTTNNRMELLAVIAGLEALNRPGCKIDVYTDSQYVQKAVDLGWVLGWEKKGFKDRKNPDLWQRFLKIYRQHQVKIHWVKGHAGNPENERCDYLATSAALNPKLKDQGF